MSQKLQESVPKPYYTADMVRALPADGNKYELVYGELLVTPAPRPLHEIVVARLTYALTQYTQVHPIGFVFGLPGDLTWGRQDVLVQPDIFVTRLDELRNLDWEQIRHLLLVAEVLSPSSLRADRFTKRRRYQDAGVPLYWVVNADAQSVETWTPGDSFPQVDQEQLLWHPEGVDAPFMLELKELFRPL